MLDADGEECLVGHGQGGNWSDMKDGLVHLEEFWFCREQFVVFTNFIDFAGISCLWISTMVYWLQKKGGQHVHDQVFCHQYCFRT